MKLEIRVSNDREGKDFQYDFSISDKTLLGLATVSFGSIALMVVSKNWKSHRKNWWE